MVARRPPIARKHSPDKLGAPQLNLAYLILLGERILTVFARPLVLAAAFVVLAWFGAFEHLYPWAHLVALILFIVLTADALGRARLVWSPVSKGEARRRVEEASGLAHRPLDVLDDRPLNADRAQMMVWEAHVARVRRQIGRLSWPKWKANFEARDPYAVRYALLILLSVAGICGWGALGGRLIASINPALGKQWHLNAPALDAWITPPEYTGLAPIMIATPADMRHDAEVIEVPEGSVISAHLAEQSGRTPVLVANGAKSDFTTDAHGDFEAVTELHSGDKISIRRGWQTMASWRVHVVADHPPQVAFAEPPAVTARKAVRLSYEAKDDYGIASVVARVTPMMSVPGADNSPVEITLASGGAKDMKRIDFEDMTSHPWAGLPVNITLVATDLAGHTSESEAASLTLPERDFFQPVARALIEERRKLLEQPASDIVRSEAANVMAGVARQPAIYHGDPVVLMALRSGAVRLVLDREHNDAPSVTNLMWQSAVRIENGSVGLAEENLRQAQRDLADALDRNATEEEVQAKLDHLRQALAQYLAQLSSRMALQPHPAQDLSQLLGPQTNMLTPQDLQQMLDSIGDLSASNARDSARQQLSQLQQMLENLRTDPPQFTEAQKQELRNLATLRALAHQQQQLMDKTFQNAQQENGSSAAAQLAVEQDTLLHQLQDVLHQTPEHEAAAQKDLSQGAGAMQQAGQNLKLGGLQAATGNQNEALKAIQRVMKSMAQNLRSSIMMLPGPGGSYGQNKDPFGRNQGASNDDGGVKVPDQMATHRVRAIMDELQRRAGDMSRPKIERDYIERLLQNF